jgi:hypothetical protein
MHDEDSAVASRAVPDRRSRRGVLAACLGSIIGLVAMHRERPTRVGKDDPVPVDRLTNH